MQEKRHEKSEKRQSAGSEKKAEEKLAPLKIKLLSPATSDPPATPVAVFFENLTLNDFLGTNNCYRKNRAATYTDQKCSKRRRRKASSFEIFKNVFFPTDLYYKSQPN